MASKRLRRLKMTGKLYFAIAAFLFLATAACGGSPTEPTPVGPGGEMPKPAQTMSEVYEAPRGFVSTMEGFVPIPDKCFRAELLGLDPGRDSIMPWDLVVRIRTRLSVCSEAPNLEGYGFSPSYDFVDERGEKATVWLAGSSGALMPGASREDVWSSKVYMDLPPVLHGLRIRWRWGHLGGRDFVRSNTISSTIENPPISVTIPLRWRYGG